MAEESQEAAEVVVLQQEIGRRCRESDRARQDAEAEMEATRSRLQSRVDDLNVEITQQTLAERKLARARQESALKHGAKRIR